MRMTQVISKFRPIYASCVEMVHPWNTSCFSTWTESYLHYLFFSFKIYIKVYALSLLLKGKIPSQQDLKHTVFGILQSSNFIGIVGFMFPFTACTLRKLFGHFNIASILFLPGFFCAALSIFCERKSRISMVSFYIANTVTQILWNLLEERNLVKSVPYGPTIIFSSSIALLLMFHKGGYHNYKDENGKSDSIFRYFRYILGPEEFENKMDHCKKNATKTPKYYSRFKIFNFYEQIIRYMKSSRSHPLCSHSYSCIYHIFEGILKTFTVGCGIEVLVNILLNIKKIIPQPTISKNILFGKEFLHHTLSVTKFVTIFKVVCCLLRWITNNDNQYNTLVSGFLAGSAFAHYNDAYIAVYIMLKTLHIIYNFGVSSNTLPEIPYFTEISYMINTGIIFHAYILKPNIVPLYLTKFFYYVSGGRSLFVDREKVGQWGFNSLNETNEIMKRLKLQRVIKYIM